MKENISVLLGKILTKVEGKVGHDSIIFTCKDGTKYQLYHEQDCCESVLIEDICGDLQDLVGARSPIVQAEENSSDEFGGHKSNSENCDSMTWTFYRLATQKGQVVIRWLGSSNGYYSERVDFRKLG